MKYHLPPTSDDEFSRRCGGAPSRPQHQSVESDLPTAPHLDFLGVEEVGVLRAVHEDLGPVPILGAPRAIPSGRLLTALPLQRGALATRVAHGGGLRGDREGGPGWASLQGGDRGTSGIRGESQDPSKESEHRAPYPSG